MRPGVNFKAHCQNSRRTAKNLGAQLKILVAPIKNQKAQTLYK